jgi:hypothetical protein
VPDARVELWFVITSGRGGSIVMLNTFVAVFPDWSLTWTVNVCVSTVVGVPVTDVDCTPNDVAIVSPAGMCPAISLNVCGVPWPPLEVMKLP